MKKILLFTFLIVSVNLFAQNDTDCITKSIDKIEIPKFKNDKVKRFAKEYRDYLKDCIIIRRNPSSYANDTVKVQQFAKMANIWENEMREVYKILASSPEENKKWSDFSTQLSLWYIGCIADSSPEENSENELEVTEQPKS